MKQMTKLDELLSELKRLGRDIRDIQKACGYDVYCDLSHLEVPKDPEALFLEEELGGIMNKLADAQAAVEYLSRPVQTEGVLRKGRNDRYYLNNVEFTCGSPIEILVEDDYHDSPFWCSGRLEHDDNGYYFTGARKTRLNGAKARIR